MSCLYFSSSHLVPGGAQGAFRIDIQLPKTSEHSSITSALSLGADASLITCLPKSRISQTFCVRFMLITISAGSHCRSTIISPKPAALPVTSECIFGNHLGPGDCPAPSWCLEGTCGMPLSHLTAILHILCTHTEIYYLIICQLLLLIRWCAQTTDTAAPCIPHRCHWCRTQALSTCLWSWQHGQGVREENVEEADLAVGNRILQQSISALYCLWGMCRSQVRQLGACQADDVGKGDSSRHCALCQTFNINISVFMCVKMYMPIHGHYQYSHRLRTSKSNPHLLTEGRLQHEAVPTPHQAGSQKQLTQKQDKSHCSNKTFCLKRNALHSNIMHNKYIINT